MKRYFAKNPIALLLLIITYSLANTDTDVAISSIIVQQPISVLSPAPTTTPLNDTANWTIYRGQSHPDLAWPWKKIEADHATFPATANAFPKQFLWGVGTSAYQVEENCTNSTYASWEKISQHYTHKAGNTCEHTKRFKDDVQLIKNSGMSTYRFSIEWSKIEPKEGIFDYAAISHYAAVIKELIGNNIKPIIGFHHYSDPQWFMDKGGFAVPENIKLFVQQPAAPLDHL
jgi:beta-glucosidase